MKNYESVEVHLHVFLSSELDYTNMSGEFLSVMFLSKFECGS
jgi:hypothetical protein